MKRFMYILLLLLLITPTGCDWVKGKICGSCEGEKNKALSERDIAQAKLKAESFMVNKLTADVASAETKATGYGFTAIVVSAAVIVFNNLIWFIIYRRKE